MTIATPARRALLMPQFQFDARRFGAGTIEVWLPASGLLGRVALGGAVATLSDRSGKGRDATQGTGANQPIFTVVNGRLCLQFDGTNDYLTCGNVLNLTGDLTWFAVSNFTSAAAFPMIFTRSDGGIGGQYEARRNDANNALEWASTHDAAPLIETKPSQTVLVAEPTVWVGTDTNTGVTQSVNGLSGGLQSWANPGARVSQAGESFLVGARNVAAPNQFAAMNLYDLGVYSSAFSLGEQLALKAALSRAYGIAVS